MNVRYWAISMADQGRHAPFDLQRTSTEVSADGRKTAQKVRHIHKPLSNQVSYFSLTLPGAVHSQQCGAQRFSALLLK